MESICIVTILGESDSTYYVMEMHLLSHSSNYMDLSHTQQVFISSYPVPCCCQPLAVPSGRGGLDDRAIEAGLLWCSRRQQHGAVLAIATS